jgi:hypothetical protein
MTTEQKEWRLSVLKRLIAEDRIMGQRLTATLDDENDLAITSTEDLWLDFEQLFKLSDALGLRCIVVSMNEVIIY